MGVFLTSFEKGIEFDYAMVHCIPAGRADREIRIEGKDAEQFAELLLLSQTD